MRVPTALVAVDFVEGITLETWHKVFETAGWPPSVSGEDLDYEKISEYLRQGGVSASLLDALQVIYDLGDEDGQELLALTLNEAGLNTAELPMGLGPCDYAAHLWCMREDRACQLALLRAQVTAQERSKRRTYREYAGESIRRVPASVRDALRDALEGWCIQNDLGEGAEVVEERRDGVVTWKLLHGYATQTPMIFDEGRRGRINYRPLHCGVVRYAEETGRLKISARTVTIANGYRQLIGRIVFGSETFFSNEHICTLEPLVKRGQAALDAHRCGAHILQARLIDALWERADNQLLRIRAPDCFKALKEMGIAAIEGNLVEARIALTLAGPSMRRAKISIKVSNRVDFNRALYDEELIERYLYEVGITRPDDESLTTLWNLHPWRQPASAWRDAFPKDVDQLIGQGLLQPIRLEGVAHPDHHGAGRVLDVREDQDGSFHGISRDRDVPSRLLSPTDVDGLELSDERWAEHLARLLPVDVPGKVRDLGSGCWFLGTRRIGSSTVAPILLARKPAIAGELLISRIKDAAPGALPVLLAPTRDGLPPGVETIILPRLLPDAKALLLDIVREMRLWGQVPAIDFAPEGVRVVLDRHLKKAWVDGVPLLKPQDEPAWFLFLERLADARGGVVDKETLSAHLGVAREPKHIKLQLKKVIKTSFQKAGKPHSERLMGELITSTEGGYRLIAGVFDPLGQGR